MEQRTVNTLGMGGKLMLTAVAVAAVAGFIGPFSATQLRAQSPPTAGSPSPSFEVASIKPNRSGDMRIGVRFQPGRFMTTGATVKQLIALAYNVRDFQVSGGPGWIGTDKYDIEAKEPDAVADELQKLPPDQRREKTALLVQSLLADRFALKLTHATKELPVYALVVAKNGPKLQEAKAGDTYPNGFKGPDGRAHPGMMQMDRSQLRGQAVPMVFLVQTLSQQLGRAVLDQTGLKGNYDFTLQWTPDQRPAAMPMGPGGPNPGADTAPPPDTSGPSIFTAIQEQLGLKLESTKGPVDILIIDRVEKPTED